MVSFFIVVVNPVGVLYHHNGVIYHNTQCEQEGKEYHEVQGVPKCRQHHEGNRHGKRNRHSHEYGIGSAHEEHKDESHQNESDDNGVYEVMQGDAGGSALIAGNAYIQI